MEEEKTYLGYRYKLTFNAIGKRTLLEATRCYKSMLEGDFSFLVPMAGTILAAHYKDGWTLRTDREYLKAALHDLPLLLYGRGGRPAQVNQTALSLVTTVLGMPKSRSSVTLSYTQGLCLCSMLDSFTRLYTGQLSIALESLPSVFSADLMEEQRAVEQYLTRALFLLAPNVSWSVHSCAESLSHGVSYDMFQILRHRLAWDREPCGGMTVDFGSPCLIHKMTRKSRPVLAVKSITVPEGDGI